MKENCTNNYKKFSVGTLQGCFFRGVNKAYDVSDYVLDNQTIAAGAVKELTYNFGMAGPSILAGWYLSNATSSGQNVSDVTVYGAYINADGDKFVIKCKNTGSSTAKVKATFRAFRVR